MSAVSVKPAEKFGRRRDGFYHLPGDRKYVSVTTVLDIIDKPALRHWAAKTAAALVLNDPYEYDTAKKAAAGIYGVRDKAADRGSMVHSLVEALFKGAPIETDSMPPEVKGYYDAFQAWAVTVRPTPLYSEATVFSDKHQYAGTLDLIAAFPDKQIRLIDFKTTSNIYIEQALQMEAYRNADFILPRGVDAVPIPMPTVRETCVVLLAPDGTFTYKPLRGEFRVFLALKYAQGWLKEHGH